MTSPTPPANVTQKPATAKSMQNTGSNLSDFQAWLGTIPESSGQWPGEQVAIDGANAGQIWIRRPYQMTIVLNQTDWLLISNSSTPLMSRWVDQDYQASWG